MADNSALPASDPTAERARYWLIPHSDRLDVHDKFTNQIFRLDPMADSQSGRQDLARWDGVAVTNLAVPQRIPSEDASSGDWIIAYALVISSPGWYPKSAVLSRVLLWERAELLSFIRDGDVRLCPLAKLKPTKEQEELQRLREENRRLKQQLTPERVKALEQVQEGISLAPQVNGGHLPSDNKRPQHGEKRNHTHALSASFTATAAQVV